MHIGAMLDLGVPEAHLREQLGRLPMANEFELTVVADDKLGISGLKATIVLKEDRAPSSASQRHHPHDRKR